ncbi:probable methylated-DNA-protein-cystein methyltransferase [Polaribacter irgensii 23-P]|uniref:Probable methylated-DNA-protein-cystein methyltransferase n=1 Tax=Polaribacter irgensii 23-P TaxID=313594 RepID=A4BYE4_9FLAO|nr:probable methylated-DNA-protein-cystein methyltransferase [Polaribacter irgensii 23-P]
MPTSCYKIPFGIARITGNPNRIQSIHFLQEDNTSSELMKRTPPLYLQPCVVQLEAYFQGQRKHFNLTVNLKESDFQVKVWKSMLKIFFGKSKSYRMQSEALEYIKTIRTVATAIGENLLWIVIPRHSVLSSHKSHIRYAGGLWQNNGY